MFASDQASRDLGITVEVSEAGRARARMQVSDAMINGLGVCHGGYIFTLADTAFAFACNGYDRVTFAAGAAIEFVLPARLGDSLVAEASERYRGKRSGIYDVLVHNQDRHLVALFRGRSRATEAPVILGDKDLRGNSDT
jgi:phenylacetic acid degradation protein PaaD